MSRIGDWWLKRYPAPQSGGARHRAVTELESSIEHIAHGILVRAKQYSPPIFLSPVAETLQVRRLPVFVEHQAGGFSPEHGLICLQGRTHELRIEGPALQRHRFTFAHELGHSLFYDMSSLPGFRMAPEVKASKAEKREEEKISNLFARSVLVPTFILETMLLDTPRPWNLPQVRKTFRVSLEVAAMSLESYCSRNCDEDVFYLISRRALTSDPRSDRKLLCLACVRHRSLTPPFYYNEGVGKYGTTSIDAAAYHSAKRPMAVEETFHSRWGSLRAHLTHYRIGEDVVWTEGKLLQRPHASVRPSKLRVRPQGSAAK